MINYIEEGPETWDLSKQTVGLGACFFEAGGSGWMEYFQKDQVAGRRWGKGWVSVTQSSPGISGSFSAATVVLWDFELDEALTIIWTFHVF
jgi:hypothetical protein